jgi:hypothetical protein
MHRWPDEEDSHTPARATNPRAGTAALLLLLAVATPLTGCPGEPPVDDDDSAVADDDDDATTPPPEPLADVLGVVNLTNVRQAQGTDYVDLAGAFGDFAALDTALVAPTAYISTWGAEAPLWRLDLGSWPLPTLGEELVLDLYDYVPWLPDEQVWWDAGDRVAVGQFLSVRFQDDTVLGYQVDDPLSPGGAGWTPGGVVSLATSGGLDIVSWSSAPEARLPQHMELVAPLPGAVVSTPSAQAFTVRWTPQDDGATVTLVLLQGLGITYVANVDDDGEHTIPAGVLHDDLGAGVVDLIASRMIETVVPHPQGDILLRARSEERARLALLEDLVLRPAYGSAGQTVVVDTSWYTGSIDAGTLFDFGPGITVQSVAPDGADPQRAAVTLTIDGDADLGPRAVSVANGGESIEAPDAFTVMNLPPADTCADADALGPLGVGQWVSSTDGLSNSLSSGYACLGWSLNGADATYAVSLTAGVPVRITATMPDPGDAALALLSSCGDPTSAVACSDGTFEGEPEEIVFTPEADGVYYVVVDGYFLSGFGSPSSPFTLTVEELQGPSPLDPAWIVAGETTTATVGGESWADGLAPADVDLGAGVTTTQAQASAGVLTVQATADASASPGPRDVTVNDPSLGPVTFESALFVTELPGTDTCAAADVRGPVGLPISARTGWSANGTNSLDDVGCFTWGSPGPEVVHALDLLAGHTVSVLLESPEDTQLYVLSDCGAAATSCIDEASSDSGFDGESEAFTDWLVPADGRYYLVVDLYVPPLGPAWEYSLTVTVD